MEPVKLKPKSAVMQLATSKLDSLLPNLQLNIPFEPEPEKPNIVILKKPVKSNSTELF